MTLVRGFTIAGHFCFPEPLQHLVWNRTVHIPSMEIILADVVCFTCGQHFGHVTVTGKEVVPSLTRQDIANGYR